MRRSLFLKIYATLLACLILTAVSSALLVRLTQDDDAGWAARRDRFIEAMLPNGSDPAELQGTLSRLGGALDADITVFDQEGRVVARVGEPAPTEAFERLQSRERTGRWFRFATRLADGRVVAVRLNASFGSPDGRRNLLLLIALITVVTALVAYPIVRHLTRRLERLRGGVGIWGNGDLAHRVPVDGRDEVAAVAAAFNQAADTVERLIRSHRSLLANASHELRSPLARLRLAVDMHETTATAAARDEIVRSLAELDDLVEEILLASRLEHPESLGSAEPVDLLALAAEEGARGDVVATGKPLTVIGDPRLLRRLVRNLIQNALRHGAPPFIVEVGQHGGAIELRVSDRGPGVPEAERERIFEAFYRPAGSGEAAGGWGLGLSLVRQIAMRHRGDVRYEDRPGGACFVARFPAC